MILYYGMSKTGFACFKELDDSGKQEVNEILKAQFDKAKQTINEYRDKLLEAKEFLLANKTITDEDFSRIVLGKQYKYHKELHIIRSEFVLKIN